MLPETKKAFHLGFEKWLASSKFQIALIVVAVAMFLVIVYRLAPDVAIKELTKVAAAYFGARVLEPIAGEIAGKINGNGKKVTKSADGD